MSALDWIGIALAIAGTVILVALCRDGDDNEKGR